MPLKTFNVIIILFMLCCHLPAQVKKITLDEILRKKAESIDPDNLYRNSTTFYKKERIEYKGMPDGVIINIISKFKAPDKIKTEMISNGQILNVRIFDGKEACEIIPVKNTFRKLTGPDLEYMKLQSEMAHPKADYRKIFANVELSEAEDVNYKYYLLICHPKQKNLAPLKIFIRQDNFLPQKVETISPITGETIITEVNHFSNVKGVKVADKTIVRSGETEQTWTMEDFRWGILLDDMEFEIPETHK